MLTPALMIKRTFPIVLLIILLPGLCFASMSIRVLAIENASQINVYSKGLDLYELANSSREETIQLERAVITIGKNGLHINNKPVSWLSIGITSSDDIIWLNGKPFRGTVTIFSNANKLSAISTMPFEIYIEGILSGEVPAGWPLETLKAQAVAARTYAFFAFGRDQKNSGARSYDVRPTVEDQVYDGRITFHPNITNAVSETAGQILTYNGAPINARFHSDCGGQTETSGHVWGENDQSVSVKDPYCQNSQSKNWSLLLSGQSISQALKNNGFDPGNIRSIEIEKYENSDRIAAVAITGSLQTVSLTGNDFRRFVGFNKIKSTIFNVSRAKGGFLFTGRGFGHGVGMCQWGAKGMGEKGFSYREILDFYYPGTVLSKIVDDKAR